MNSAPRAFVVALSLFALPVAFLPLSCAGQGEGDRCDHKNGDADCATGLVCKQSQELGGNADICCPNGTSQNPECIPGGGVTSATSSTTTSTGDATTSSGDTGSSASGSTSASSGSGSTSSATGSSSVGGGGGGAGGTGGAGG